MAVPCTLGFVGLGDDFNDFADAVSYIHAKGFVANVCQIIVVGDHNDLPGKKTGTFLHKFPHIKDVIVADVLSGLVEEEGSVHFRPVVFQKGDAQSEAHDVYDAAAATHLRLRLYFVFSVIGFHEKLGDWKPPLFGEVDDEPGAVLHNVGDGLGDDVFDLVGGLVSGKVGGLLQEKDHAAQLLLFRFHFSDPLPLFFHLIENGIANALLAANLF